MSVNSITDIWDAVLEIIGSKLTSTAMTTWFSDCTPIEINGSDFVVHTTSEFKRNIIVSRFKDTIEAALSDIFSANFNVVILTGDELENYNESKADNDPFPEMLGYTFDNFIVGKSNVFAHNAAVAVTEEPGTTYNPLFIYGNSGLGKTHLLMAIGHTMREKNPDIKIEYIKGDDFINQLNKSIKERTGEEFRTKFRNADLFLVDDIQFIAGKQATQEEFFHTFNSIYECGHQIVVTSDRPPMEMSLLEDRLRTRFEGGLLVDIQPPDIETREVITRTKAAQLGLQLSDDVVTYIAETITSNVRQIEGIIKRLTAYKGIMNYKINRETVDRAIEDIIRKGTFIPSPSIIINETARFYQVSAEDIRSTKRGKNIMMARQVSMYLIRTLTNLSLKDIGVEFEGKNHSTVIYSIKQVESLMENEKSFSDQIRDISSNINTIVANQSEEGGK